MTENAPNLRDEKSAADWEKTPDSVKRLVESLVSRIKQLEQQYEELKAENQLLREQVKQNSKNSSQPPSQDVSKGFKAKAKKQKGKPRGAQFGHVGHERKLYPVEQCQQVEEHYPGHCIECGTRLQGADPDPYRVQIVEIPPVAPVVSEHRFHALTCQQCGAATRAWDEAIINGSGYGERVVAHVGVLSGQYRQSHRMVQFLLGELFGIELSVGSINQLRQESSESVAQVVAQAHEYVQGQAQVNVDETSFAQGNSDGKNPTLGKGWLWVMVTPLVSYFAVCLSRSGAVAQRLMGAAFDGIVGSDRFSGYNWMELNRRQLGRAHLKRDFTRIAERTGVSSELGKALLEQQRLLFEYWYRVRDGTLSRTEFIAVVAPIQEQVRRLLRAGAGYDIAPQEKTPLFKDGSHLSAVVESRTCLVDVCHDRWRRTHQ